METKAKREQRMQTHEEHISLSNSTEVCLFSSVCRQRVCEHKHRERLCTVRLHSVLTQKDAHTHHALLLLLDTRQSALMHRT